MSATELTGFVRVESGVNSSKNYIRTPLACHLPNLVSAESIRSVDADTYNITGLDGIWVHSSQGFVDQQRIAKALWCCCRKNIQPARSNDCGPE
jgi:hypothetical protein